MKKTVCILWLLCTVLASAIAQQTPTTAQIMSKASEYWAKQDYTQAASWYRKAAERGDATAQNCLGNCYFSGKGVDQSDMYALAWYQRAAAQDNPDGMVNLGYCYYIGKGIAQDYDTAMSWLQKAKVLYTRARKKRRRCTKRTGQNQCYVEKAGLCSKRKSDTGFFRYR